MKAKRLLFLVMAICLASGVKAQFYDGPDDIYYYVEEYNEYEDFYWDLYPGTILPKSPHYTGKIKKKQIEKDDAKVLIFNFDGMKAAELTNTLEGRSFGEVKSTIANNPSYYEDKIETTEYNKKYYSSSSSETIYNYKFMSTTYSYKFSADRNTLKCVNSEDHPVTRIYKRVDKSYFKVGRSRTPSGTMYE